MLGWPWHLNVQWGALHSWTSLQPRTAIRIPRWHLTGCQYSYQPAKDMAWANSCLFHLMASADNELRTDSVAWYLIGHGQAHLDQRATTQTTPQHKYNRHLEGTMHGSSTSTTGSLRGSLYFPIWLYLNLSTRMLDLHRFIIYRPPSGRSSPSQSRSRSSLSKYDPWFTWSQATHVFNLRICWWLSSLCISITEGRQSLDSAGEEETISDETPTPRQAARKQRNSFSKRQRSSPVPATVETDDDDDDIVF